MSNPSFQAVEQLGGLGPEATVIAQRFAEIEAANVLLDQAVLQPAALPMMPGIVTGDMRG